MIELKDTSLKDTTFLVTGVAGFIGSHLLERLLSLGQRVVGVDNFSTGFQSNLERVKQLTGERYSNFTFIEGDVADGECLERACKGVNVILHQAALGSVKRSVEDPIKSNYNNVDGTLQVFDTARRMGVSRVVYASSSSVYGDSAASPKREEDTGRVLSPYAATKAFGEVYARLFFDLYGLETVGLRYFNVFGPRQNPEGDYAAVIPRWIDSVLKGVPCVIYGDGKTSRDFCFIDNVVNANLRAACCPKDSCGTAYNIAVGDETSLNELHSMIVKLAGVGGEPRYEPFRSGDVRHSRADVSLASKSLGYEPDIRIEEGLRRTIAAMRS